MARSSPRPRPRSPQHQRHEPTCAQLGLRQRRPDREPTGRTIRRRHAGFDFIEQPGTPAPSKPAAATTPVRPKRDGLRSAAKPARRSPRVPTAWARHRAASTTFLPDATRCAPSAPPSPISRSASPDSSPRAPSSASRRASLASPLRARSRRPSPARYRPLPLRRRRRLRRRHRLRRPRRPAPRRDHPHRRRRQAEIGGNDARARLQRQTRPDTPPP